MTDPNIEDSSEILKNESVMPDKYIEGLNRFINDKNKHMEPLISEFEKLRPHSESPALRALLEFKKTPFFSDELQKLTSPKMLNAINNQQKALELFQNKYMEPLISEFEKLRPHLESPALRALLEFKKNSPLSEELQKLTSPKMLKAINNQQKALELFKNKLEDVKRSNLELSPPDSPSLKLDTLPVLNNLKALSSPITETDRKAETLIKKMVALYESSLDVHNTTNDIIKEFQNLFAQANSSSTKIANWALIIAILSNFISIAYYETIRHLNNQTPNLVEIKLSAIERKNDYNAKIQQAQNERIIKALESNKSITPPGKGP